MTDLATQNWRRVNELIVAGSRDKNFSHGARLLIYKAVAVQPHLSAQSLGPKSLGQLPAAVNWANQANHVSTNPTTQVVLPTDATDIAHLAACHNWLQPSCTL